MFEARTRHAVLSVFSLLLFLLAAVIAPSLPVCAQGANASGLEATQRAFRQIHDKVAPAVVSINSQIEVNGNNSDSLFDFFFGQSTQPRIQRAAGSGVIIRPEGIVLTNSHVVANATKVTVQLAGQDKPLPAEVLQTDPRTDLAIVRITQKGTYPTATLGDATKVEVGDWAIAFGNPFNLATTMTVGVISAIGRRLPSPNDAFDYNDLLQTDASINPGNSGGPLVNINGDVVGINFMIYSPGDQGGSVGIGFAIPINDYTRNIIDTMAAGHAVERGLLGVRIRSLDAAMRDQYGVKEGGVFVDSVEPGKAADKAGIKGEDVITSYNGTPVTDADQFVRLVEMTKPGSTVPVVIVRDKKPQTVNVTIGSAGDLKTASTTVDQHKVGLTVTTLTPNMANRLGLQTTSGVLVTQVEAGSPAEDAGLQQGDVIIRVGTVPVNTEEEFWSELTKADAKSQNGVLLRVRRGNTPTTLTMPKIDTGDKNKKE